MAYPQNTIKPGLKDVLDQHRDDIFSSFNCHAIGEIVTFDSTKMTATVSFVYQKTYFSTDPLAQPEVVNYPLLMDCPVVILYGGQAGLTFPVSPKDTALILFNDRDIDTWFTSGNQTPPNTGRMHALADGIVLVGLKNLLNPITPYDMLHAKLFWGMTEVGVSATQVRVANAASTLGTLMASLMTDLTALNTALTTFGGALAGASDPVVQSAGAALSSAVVAVQSSITTLTAQYAGLLE